MQNETNPAEVIRFEKNYNNKLTGDYFTSIRLKDIKYRKGNRLKFLLMENGVWRTLGMVTVVDSKPLRLNQITEFMAYLDTGMGLNETKDMLYRRYKDQVKDLNTADFVLVLFERVKASQLQSRLF
jgi:uncharacterized protein YqfB (UPF0267 family)